MPSLIAPVLGLLAPTAAAPAAPKPASAFDMRPCWFPVAAAEAAAWLAAAEDGAAADLDESWLAAAAACACGGTEEECWWSDLSFEFRRSAGTNEQRRVEGDGGEVREAVRQ